MIDKVYVRNFLSIKNAEVNLGKVNLLIGTNNSGKSNFLKAFVAVKERLIRLNYDDFIKKSYNHLGENNIAIQLCGNKEEILYQEIFYNELFDEKRSSFVNIIAISNDFSFLSNNKKIMSKEINSSIVDDLFSEYNYNGFIFGENYSFSKYEKQSKHSLSRESDDILIYDVDVKTLRNYSSLNPTDFSVNSNASNLVSFLDNMRDTNPDVIRKIEDSLQKTVSNFKELRFKKGNANQKMLGLVDINDIIFWADELSEGTLYFLAILAIIHQPNPPKLLLLEEPEKNVHPKRIHEIIDYLFQLSEEKDIQIIITTHSPIVVDEFKDIPENVHLFDFCDNQTVITNAADVINEQNKERAKKDYSLLDFNSSTLGEQWLMGFLGGVPTK
ncbi:MAG: AAA family ATPase [Bacteroidales bacterium]|nr:AAA family ATPase [Bacteroidales bacterium]